MGSEYAAFMIAAHKTKRSAWTMWEVMRRSRAIEALGFLNVNNIDDISAARNP